MFSSFFAGKENIKSVPLDPESSCSNTSDKNRPSSSSVHDEPPTTPETFSVEGKLRTRIEYLNTATNEMFPVIEGLSESKTKDLAIAAAKRVQVLALYILRPQLKGVTTPKRLGFAMRVECTILHGYLKQLQGQILNEPQGTRDKFEQKFEELKKGLHCLLREIKKNPELILGEDAV